MKKAIKKVYYRLKDFIKIIILFCFPGEISVNFLKHKFDVRSRFLFTSKFEENNL